MNKIDLEKAIQEANRAYSAGIPFITDEEYDLLWQALYAIDSDNSLLYHTAQAYNQVHGKSWHKHQIFGTNKAFNMQDLRPFMMRFGSQQLTIEPKYDGCAAVITIERSGIRITLEGDGKSGGDISHLLPYINIHFPLKNFQAVEILLPVAEWNPEYGKNPRNVVAGWLARKYEAPGAMMTAISHNAGDLHKDYLYDGDLDALGELLIKTHAEWSKIYPIDGLMIKVKDEKARLIAGNNGTTSSWSIAWKPPIQIKKTTVVDIEWNVSRLGRVVPTVVYEPIDLCGTTNSRVTGNNARWISDRNIKVGSQITVGKAGEIIPKIVEVQETPQDLVLPNDCPKCDSLLQWEGVHLVCYSKDCIAKKVIALDHFYSIRGIMINGIGELMAEKLLNDQKCYSVLIERPWALLDMYSYNIIPDVRRVLGDGLFANLLKEVTEISGTRNMAHFITGLGYAGLGYRSALKMCQFIKTGELSVNIPMKSRINFAEAVMVYKKAVEEMQIFEFCDIPSPAKIKYCITGSLSKSRDAMVELLGNYSFGFSLTVTSDTNYLIVGEDPGRTKIEKAVKYNVKQITEEQLMELIKET